MSQNDKGVPSGPGSQASPQTPAGLGHTVSIPDAWLRTFKMEWQTDAGPVTFFYPGDMTEDDIADLKALLDLAFRGMVRRAQAIEARRAETGTGSVADESAVTEGHAPTPTPENPNA